MRKKWLILGVGGHGRVVLDTLLIHGFAQQALGFVVPDPVVHDASICGIPLLWEEEMLRNYSPDQVVLVNGLGGVGDTEPRAKIFQKFTALGYSFLTVVHPWAVVSASAVLGPGVQVMAGAIIQTGSRVGENTIVNTRAVIDHDGQIGAHVHIAPGAVLSGGVEVGERSHIGTGATVIQGIRLGRSVLVAAGAVVVRHVADGVKVVGVPAMEISYG
ncbi:MAG: acetyltransferase [Magnetococcus sp. DMHC-6]